MSNPHVLDSSHWQAALEHYHCDRLAEAYGQILEHGIGEAGGHLRWYRVIEAETITRSKSVTEKVTNWLSVEYVPEEVLDLSATLIEQIVAACDQVANRLGWEHGDATLVSILAQETEAPWASHPYGYCVHKEDFEKICLPNYLVDDPDEFSQAVAHEYAHVISEALADGYSPRWLDEALSVLLESRFDDETWRAFRDGEVAWKTPRELEHAIEARGDEGGLDDEEIERQAWEEDDKDEIWFAYQQAGWIGRYLCSLKSEKQLGVLLRKVADESPAWNLGRVLKGQDRVDAALRSVYGMGVNQLFREALEFLKRQEGVA